jgi:hypothetical protein
MGYRERGKSVLSGGSDVLTLPFAFNLADGAALLQGARWSFSTKASLRSTETLQRALPCVLNEPRPLSSPILEKDRAYL